MIVSRLYTVYGGLWFAYFPPAGAQHLSPGVRFLIKTDPDFMLEQAGLELVRRREKILINDQDTNPLGPDYPILEDVLRDWGIDDIEQTGKVLKRCEYI